MGLGNPYEENKLAQKIVRNCEQESSAHHLCMDTIEDRLTYFNRSVFS